MSAPGSRGMTTASCPDCGKVRYLTRADAKRSARRQSRRMRAYRCGQFWHLATFGAYQRVVFYREKGIG